MVQAIRLPIATDHVEEPSAGPIQRVQGLAGLAILTLAATSLGLPLSGGHLATDLILVILGFKITTRLRQGQYEDRNVLRFWLGHVGRIGVPLLVALGLALSYWTATGVASTAQQRIGLGRLAVELNGVAGLTGDHLETLTYLRLVAVITTFALGLPLLLALCGKLTARGRAIALVLLATAATLARVAMVSTGTSDSSDALFSLLRADGLLIGAAIAVTPLPLLRRLVPSRLVAPLFLGLLLAFVVAPGGSSAAEIVAGPAAWITMVLSAAVVTAAAGGGLVGRMSSAVDDPYLRWLGARTLSILIWHQLIGSVLPAPEGTAEAGAMGQWPGLLVFAARVIFTLAAAALSHRFLEIPLANLARQRVGALKPSSAAGPPKSSSDRPLSTSRSTEPSWLRRTVTITPAPTSSPTSSPAPNPNPNPNPTYRPTATPVPTPEPDPFPALTRDIPLTPAINRMQLPTPAPMRSLQPEPQATPSPRTARSDPAPTWDVSIPSAVAVNHPAMRPLRLSIEANVDPVEIGA